MVYDVDDMQVAVADPTRQLDLNSTDGGNLDESDDDCGLFEARVTKRFADL